MKRKVLLFLFFITSVVLQGQTKYGILVQTSLSPFMSWGGSHGGSHRITIGNKSISKGANFEDITVIEYDFVYINDNPSTIVCNGTTVGNKDDSDCTESITIPYNGDNFTSADFYGCIADSEIFGIYLPQPINSNICRSQTINLTGGWNWQYSYNGSTWTSFPNVYQAKRNIAFKITDLTGYDGKQKIYFRAGYLTQFTDFIIYDIAPCAPNLVGSPEKVKPSCYQENDGQVTFTFDRNLIDNEYFSLNLTQVVNGNNLPPINKYVSMDEFINNKITFTGVGSGTYFLHYQTFQVGNSTPFSDNYSDEFTIEPVDPLTFKIKKADNPLCANETVEIAIDVKGGTENYKFYVDGILTTATKNQTDGFYYIKGLIPTASNNIKVMDKNNCIEKSL